MASFSIHPPEPESLIDFCPLLPDDIKILAPTVYTRLNVLNYCQFLKVFLKLRFQHSRCEHTDIIETKLKIIRQVISRIVETDTVFNDMNAH
ncbi:hypothetical protein [Rhinolophus gammaherpesvirus 1]|uniref:Uncharacterized protein n=1 Tax=Rhinolophus gammaherpesvirus 1 TaxID=2054179 RepID=A0A2Z5U792_9GAMA|nr:hypothetical protein [Rhinolophus gammaherpesvirus 1]BBB06521.1 hypothetical protein [Rhinolophus gammaherpesvirus 1]